MNMTTFWIVIFVVFMIFELFKLDLFGICIATGCLAGLIAKLLHLQSFVQVIIFVIITVVMFVFVRPVALIGMQKAKGKKQISSMIGKNAVVVSEINNRERIGRVKFNDTEWQARSSRNDTILLVGTVVKILDVNGVKLIVKKVGR